MPKIDEATQSWRQAYLRLRDRSLPERAPLLAMCRHQWITDHHSERRQVGASTTSIPSRRRAGLPPLCGQSSVAQTLL